jgi:hypothetical protein
MIQGSFIQDDMIFCMSRDGVFNNSRSWNRKTKEPVDLELCLQGYERKMTEIDQAMQLLQRNMLHHK